jgi:hypothetical protein
MSLASNIFMNTSLNMMAGGNRCSLINREQKSPSHVKLNASNVKGKSSGMAAQLNLICSYQLTNSSEQSLS